MDCSEPGFCVLHYLLAFAQTHVHWVGDAIQPSNSLLLPTSPALNLFQHQDLFQRVSSSHQVANGLELQPEHQTFQWIFRVDFLRYWLVWSLYSLKSLLQTRILKASILWHSAFFMVQLSHLYMTAGKAISLTIWTFVGKVVFLLFNTLSRLVIAFLLWSNHLLTSRLQTTSSVILEPKKIKSLTVTIVSPSMCHEMMRADAMIFIFWILSFKPAFSPSF